MSIVEYHVEERPLLRRMREVAVFLRSKTKSHRFEKLIQTIDERVSNPALVLDKFLSNH